MPRIPLVRRAIVAAELGNLPDLLIRFGIRRMLSARRREISGDRETCRQRRAEFLEQCRTAPVAVATEEANEQHYELPPEFFLRTLGPRLKYSCCYWPEGVDNLADAETAALAKTCERARIENGQSILELGCGWGSLSLWMAEHYPDCRITAVSNSSAQREFITERARTLGLENLTVVTADMNAFDPDEMFDRVVSVEMFEHMRNHAELMRRVASWLNPDGRLFVHIFCHKSEPYFFEPAGDEDWMARYFFTGGMMPSNDLLLEYQSESSLDEHWSWSGFHYERTCNAWLANLDRQRGEILSILAGTYGEANAALWLQRWRMFFMACAELFGYHGGSEWFVSHYLFQKRLR